MEWWQKALVIWLGGNFGLVLFFTVDHFVPTRWPRKPQSPTTSK